MKTISRPLNGIRARAYPAIEPNTKVIAVWLTAIVRLLRKYVRKGAALRASG